jgi:NAD(P)H-hydrate epimerase
VTFTREVARTLPLPTVVDADGLRALEGEGSLADAPAQRVLTPHPGELAGLLGSSTAEIQADRPAAARRAAQQLGVPVLLKGARTLVAFPDGTIHLNPTGNPGMASAGTGDVLTGLLGGLLAGGADAGRAATAAAYLHGLAGDVAAAEVGEASLRATHIARRVSGTLRAIAEGGIPEPFTWR